MPSFSKRFNVYDLGYLAGRVFHVLHYSPRQFNHLVLGILQPDFLDLVGAWACNHHPYVFEDPRFEALYERGGLPHGPGSLPTDHEKTFRTYCKKPQVQSGRFIRRALRKDSGSPERHLLDRLQAAQQDPTRSGIS